MADPNNVNEVIQFELEDVFDTLVLGVERDKWTVQDAYTALGQTDRLGALFTAHLRLIGFFE